MSHIYNIYLIFNHRQNNNNNNNINNNNSDNKKYIKNDHVFIYDLPV